MERAEEKKKPHKKRVFFFSAERERERFLSHIVAIL